MRPALTSPARALVIRAGDATVRPLRGARGASASLVGTPPLGLLDVRRVVIEPHTGVGPLHLHRQAENTYFVLAGTLDVTVGDRVCRLDVGDAILIPPGVRHRTNNPSECAAVILAVYDRPADRDFEALEDGRPSVVSDGDS